MKLTESSLRQLIREVIREADESDKYTHIGYGRYKEKGKEKDKDAETFKKTDSGKFEPFEKEKGEEKPKPKQAKIAADPFADKDSEDKEKHADTIMAITKDDVEFDGYDANDRPMFVSIDDPDLGYTVDKKGNIWRHDGFKDKVIGQTSADIDKPEDETDSTQIEKTRNNLNKASDDQLEYIIDDQDIWGELEDWDIEPGKIPEDPAARAELTDAIYELVFKPIANDPDEFEDMIDSYELGPPKPDDLKDFLDGFGKTDVYSDGEVSNEMIGEFDFEDNKVTYSNSNFREFDDWNLAKDVLGPLKKAGIKYKKYKDRYSAGVIVNTEDLEGLTDVLKQTVGNKGGGGDEAYAKAHPDEVFKGPGVPSGPLEPDEEKEIASWVKKVSSKEFKNAVEDTLSDAAKYDPDKARPDDIMNTGHGLSATTRAATKELEAEGKPVPKYSDGEAKPHSLPLYQEIEYIAKHGTTPEKMKKLLDGSTEGARKYWYLKFGLRSPEQIPFDDSYDKTGKPPSFKESITSQLKKEFKQYGFTQKSKNWKQVMI